MKIKLFSWFPIIFIRKKKIKDGQRWRYAQDGKTKIPVKDEKK